MSRARRGSTSTIATKGGRRDYAKNKFDLPRARTYGDTKSTARRVARDEPEVTRQGLLALDQAHHRHIVQVDLAICGLNSAKLIDHHVRIVDAALSFALLLKATEREPYIVSLGQGLVFGDRRAIQRLRNGLRLTSLGTDEGKALRKEDNPASLARCLVHELGCGGKVLCDVVDAAHLHESGEAATRRGRHLNLLCLLIAASGESFAIVKTCRADGPHGWSLGLLYGRVYIDADAAAE